VQVRLDVGFIRQSVLEIFEFFSVSTPLSLFFPRKRAAVSVYECGGSQSFTLVSVHL
jgi:hypothetical protein